MPTLRPEGSRARSLYPDSSRPATLCRPARAYPELFALLGSRTPDLRGLFLRGHGGNSAALGIQQGDAIRNITGRISFADAYIDGASGVMNSQGSSGSYATGGLTPNGSPDDFSFDASRVVPTANENRPVNQAVRYLVRARP